MLYTPNTRSRRKAFGRKRDVKLEIRRMEKLMSKISGLQTALRLFIREFPNVEDIVFVFGASPRRPQHVYQFLFPHGSIAPLPSEDMARNRTIEVLSRKVIRALISKGVGSASYTGGLVPFRLQLRSKTSHQEMKASSCVPAVITYFNENNHICSTLTWFQCRHVIKGIALGNPSPKDNG